MNQIQEPFKDIANHVIEKLKKQERNYSPEIFAYETHILTTRKRGDKQTIDSRFGLKCQFCGTTFKYQRFFNTQH